MSNGITRTITLRANVSDLIKDISSAASGFEAMDKEAQEALETIKDLSKTNLKKLNGDVFKDIFNASSVEEFQKKVIEVANMMKSLSDRLNKDAQKELGNLSAKQTKDIMRAALKNHSKKALSDMVIRRADKNIKTLGEGNDLTQYEKYIVDKKTANEQIAALTRMKVFEGDNIGLIKQYIGFFERLKNLNYLFRPGQKAKIDSRISSLIDKNGMVKGVFSYDAFVNELQETFKKHVPTEEKQKKDEYAQELEKRKADLKGLLELYKEYQKAVKEYQGTFKKLEKLGDKATPSDKDVFEKAKNNLEEAKSKLDPYANYSKVIATSKAGTPYSFELDKDNINLQQLQDMFMNIGNFKNIKFITKDMDKAMTASAEISKLLNNQGSIFDLKTVDESLTKIKELEEHIANIRNLNASDDDKAIAGILNVESLEQAESIIAKMKVDLSNDTYKEFSNRTSGLFKNLNEEQIGKVASSYNQIITDLKSGVLTVEEAVNKANGLIENFTIEEKIEKEKKVLSDILELYNKYTETQDDLDLGNYDDEADKRKLEEKLVDTEDKIVEAEREYSRAIVKMRNGTQYELPFEFFGNQDENAENAEKQIRAILEDAEQMAQVQDIQIITPEMESRIDSAKAAYEDLTDYVERFSKNGKLTSTLDWNFEDDLTSNESLLKSFEDSIEQIKAASADGLIEIDEAEIEKANNLMKQLSSNVEILRRQADFEESDISKKIGLLSNEDFSKIKKEYNSILESVGNGTLPLNEALEKTESLLDSIGGEKEIIPGLENKISKYKKEISDFNEELGYFSKRLSEDAYKTSGKKDATSQLKNAFEELKKYNANPDEYKKELFAKQAREIDLYRSWKEAQKQGVAESTLNKYRPDFINEDGSINSSFEKSIGSFSKEFDKRTRWVSELERRINELKNRIAEINDKASINESTQQDSGNKVEQIKAEANAHKDNADAILEEKEAKDKLDESQNFQDNKDILNDEQKANEQAQKEHIKQQAIIEQKQREEQERLQKEQLEAQERAKKERIKNTQQTATELSNAFKELNKGSLEYQKSLDKSNLGQPLSPEEIVNMENYKALIDDTLPSAFEFIDAINSSSNAFEEEQEIASQVSAEIEKYNQTTKQSVDAINKSKKMVSDIDKKKQEEQQKEIEKQALEKQREEQAKLEKERIAAEEQSRKDRVAQAQQTAKDLSNTFKKLDKGSLRYQKLLEKKNSGQDMTPDEIVAMQNHEALLADAKASASEFANAINSSSDALKEEKEAVAQVNAEIEKYDKSTRQSINAINESKKISEDRQTLKKIEDEQKEQEAAQIKAQQEQEAAQKNIRNEQIKTAQRTANELAKSYEKLDKGSLRYQKLFDKKESGQVLSPNELVQMKDYETLLTDTEAIAFEFADAINSNSNALTEEKEALVKVNAEREKYNQSTKKSINAINESKKAKEEKNEQKRQEEAQKALEKERVKNAEQAAKDIIKIYDDIEKDTPKYLQLKDIQANGGLLGEKDLKFIKDYEKARPSKASLDYKTLENRVYGNESVFDGELKAIETVDAAISKHEAKIEELKKKYRIDKANSIDKNVNNLYNQLDKDAIKYQQNIAKRDAGETLSAKDLKQISNYEGKLAEVTKILSAFEESILSNNSALEEEISTVESLQERREKYNKNITETAAAVKKEREDKQSAALLKDQRKRAKDAIKKYDKAYGLEDEYQKAIQIDPQERNKTQKKVIADYTKAVEEAVSIQAKLKSEGFDETEQEWIELTNAAKRYGDELKKNVAKNTEDIGKELNLIGKDEPSGEYFFKEDIDGFKEFNEQRQRAFTLTKEIGEISATINENGGMTNPDNIKYIDELRNKSAELNDVFIKVRNSSGKFIDTKNIAGYENRISAVKEKLDNLLKSKALTGSQKTIFSQMRKELDDGVVENRLNEMNTTIDNFQSKMDGVGQDSITFMDRFKGRLRSLTTYLATFVSFYQVVNVIKEMASAVKEFDTALFEMRKVSSEPIDVLKEYQKESFEIGKSIGTDALSLQKSVADWMRLGETFENAKESAKVSNILLNVSEFSSIDEATTALTSISAAYEDIKTGIDKMDIIDKLNAIGDNYAISTDGVATALQDSASALKTAGNDMNEALALITAGNTVVQDPSKTGKGIRTIALRLTGTKEATKELEEMGEETEGVIETQSKLRETIMTATKVGSNGFKGFDILDKNGNYKSTYEIMLGLSEIYEEILESDKKLGSNKANLLLETIAGKNRANIAASILQNPDVLKNAYNTATFEYEGVATMEEEKYLDSLQAKLEQLKTAYQELGAAAVDSDFLKVLTEMGTTGLEGLTKYVDLFGTLGSIVPVITGGIGMLGGGIFNMDKNGNISKPIFDAFKKSQKFSLTELDSNFVNEVINKGLVGNASELDLISDSMKGVNSELIKFAKNSKTIEGFKNQIDLATGATTKATQVFKSFGASLLNIGINFAAGVAISLIGNYIAKVIDDVVHAREHIQEAMDDAKSSIDEANSSFESQSSSIENIKKRYAELAEGVKVTSSEIKNMSLSDEEFSEFLNLNKQLSDIAPDLASGYDTQGNALIKLGDGYTEVTNNIDEYIEKLREARNLEVSGNMEDLFAGVKANVSDLEKQSDEISEIKTNIENAAKTGFTFDNKDYDYYKDILKQLGIKEEDQMYYFSGQTSSIQVKETAANILESGEAVSNAIAIVNARYGKDYKNLIEGTNALKEQQQKEWQSISEEMLQSIQAGGEYQKLKIKGQGALDAFQSAFNNLDFRSIIENNGIEEWSDLQGWIENNVVIPIKDVSPQINDAFDMQEQFENNEVSAKEYIDTITELLDSDKIKNLSPEVQDALSNAFTFTFKDGQTLDDAFSSLYAEHGIRNILKDISQYKNNLKELNELGIDASKTVFGNIDTNNRQILEWTEDNIEKYRSQIESWGENPDNLLGSHSTIFGASSQFDGQEIAFSPMLQTDHGAELLSADTVNRYINELITKASADGNGWTNEELFKLDAEGLEVDGKHIKGLIADIGDTAKATGEAMHLISENSELQAAIRDTKDFQEYINGLNKEQIQILVDIYEPGMTIDECDAKIKELQSTAAEGIDLEARTNLEDYNKAKEEKSYLADYESYRSMMDEAKQLYSEEKIGDKVFQKAAKAFSVNGMTDAANWEENIATLGKYFTEDARDGLNVFLQDLQGIGVAAQDASGNWQLSFDDMEQSANDLYMPLEMLTVLLSGLQEYGFTNDFFANEQDGAEVIANLNEQLATEKAKLLELQEQQEQGTLVDENGNVIQAQIDKVAELEERLASAKKNMEEFVKATREDMEKGRESAKGLAEAYAEDFAKLDKYNEDGTRNESYDYLVSEYVGRMQELAAKYKIEIPLDFQLNNPDIDTKLTENGQIQVDVVVNGKEDLEAAQEVYESTPEEQRKNLVFNFDVQNKELLDETERQRDELTSGDNEVTVNINANTEAAMQDMRQAAEEIDKVDGKTANMNVNINANNNALSEIEKTSKYAETYGGTVTQTQNVNEVHTTTFTETGADNVINKANEVSSASDNTDKGHTATFDETGADNVIDQADRASAAANKVGGTRTAIFKASDQVTSVANNISSTLNNLNGKTAHTYIYTHRETVGGSTSSPATGTTGFVSSHAIGTVLSGMKAYFGGHNIALSEDQKALVGEEGMEGLVRDGQFYLIGKNSPEIRDLKKGDIIFSAKQTKAILNGQKTSRGKTIGMPSHADGTANVLSKGYITAFADGLMHAYAGTGGSRGPSFGSSKSSSSSSSNPSTKSTNNNTKAVKENTKSNKNKTKSTKKNTQSLDKLQKKWDALEDWIDDWLSAWDRVYNELDQYASEIHQTYGKQNAYIDKMYTKIDEYNKNYSAMYNKYMSQAAASGLSQTYIKKIQDGTIDIETLKTKNKKGKTSLGNEKLVAQIEEYKRWYDLAQGVKEKLLELRAVQAELANQKLTNIQDDHDKSVDMLSNTVDYYKQRIELIKTLGESYKSTNHLELDGNSLYSGRTRFDTSHTDYNVNLGLSYGLALDNQRKVVQMHQKEYDELLKEFNKLVKAGKIVEGSDTWKEWKATLTGLQTTIMADKQAFLELKEELMDYHWEAFNKNIETINYSLKEFDDILEHINSENLFNDKGVLTKEGLGYIGTIGLAMSEAKQKLVDYQNAVKTLEQQYKNGNISQETYTEKLREYLDAIRNASNEVDNYKDKLIDLYKNQMQAENEALKENISLRQESLKRLREYETYAKTIRNKNKDINALQAQIASLSGVSTQEGRAELARLRAQLQEAQEDLSDTQQEHRWDMMEQGFSDMAENADKTLDDVTKNLERNSDLQTKIVNQMLDKIKSSYKQTYSEINKIITDAGIVLSERTEKDVKDLSNKNTAATEMNKAEGTVSYDNNKDKSTGTVKPDNVTKAVKTKIELNSLTMNKTKTSIYVGASEKLTASKVPSTAQTGGITWSSSNTKVATVSGGTVKGVAAGSATITATCDGKTATCTVTVSKKPAAKKSTTTKPTTTTATTKNGESPTKKEQTALSWHKNGVAVRASASEKSKKITAVPYNKRATLVLDSKGKQQTKNGGGYTWIKVKYAGKTGWAKKKFLKFAKGAKRIDEDQIGITQDAGAELIMSRGRMLVPTQLYKGDTVYPNDITEKLWDIGKLGTEGIKEKIERDLQIKIPNGLNGIKENTENNFGDYNVTINALQKLDRKEIQQLSDYFYNDWYKRMKKDLVASGIKR